MQDLTITTDMILAAVSKHAVEQNLTAAVATTLSKQMAEYFHRDHYGRTDFQQSCHEFIQAIVLDVLEQRRDALRAAVELEVARMIDAVSIEATTKLIERMRNAIT